MMELPTMSNFDYEDFVKKSRKDGLTLDKSQDVSSIYDQLYKSKCAVLAEGKVKLVELQKRKKLLKKKLAVNDSFNKELFNRRIAITDRNAKMYDKIIQAEVFRYEALIDHVKRMEDLDKLYSDFAKDSCDSKGLKNKILDLKNKKLFLQETFNQKTAELQKIMASIKEIPLPKADELKQVKEEISKMCVGDIASKDEQLQKLNRFIEDCKMKINSN